MGFGNKPLRREVFLEEAILTEWIISHLNKVQGGGGVGRLRSVDGAKEGTPGTGLRGLLESENRVWVLGGFSHEKLLQGRGLWKTSF